MTNKLLNNIKMQLTPEMGPQGRPVGASRPPWGWLGVGIVAMSVVYWLWGCGSTMPKAPAPTSAKVISRSSGLSSLESFVDQTSNKRETR